jgi:hypothetical protein
MRGRVRMTGAALLGGLAMMPGCVVWDIRDELRRTNERIDSIKVDLAKTNELLENVNAELATTNATMADVQQRLAVLQPVADSLDSLEDSLATVKAMIEKIPFMDGPEGQEPAEPDGDPAQGTGAPPR